MAVLRNNRKDKERKKVEEMISIDMTKVLLAFDTIIIIYLLIKTRILDDNLNTAYIAIMMLIKNKKDIRKDDFNEEDYT